MGGTPPELSTGTRFMRIPGRALLTAALLSPDMEISFHFQLPWRQVATYPKFHKTERPK